MADDTEIVQVSSETAAAIESSTVKRRGRPSAKTTKANNIRGIIDTPTDKNNIIELCSSYLQIFKKIPDILKTFNMTRVWLKFRPTGMEITCREHQQKTNNKFFIHGDAMNYYYFAKDAATAWKNNNSDEELEILNSNALYICCTTSHLIDIFKYINDSFTELRIIVRRVEKKWYFSFTSSNGCVDVNEVPRALSLSYAPIAGMPEYESEIYDYSVDQNYPLSFDLTQDTFKIIIMKAKEGNITISKRINTHLTFEILPKDGVPSWSIFNDPDKINLISSIKPDQLVSVVINTEFLKIANNTCISFMDKVRISLAEGKPVSFRWYVRNVNDKEICYLHTYL